MMENSNENCAILCYTVLKVKYIGVQIHPKVFL